MSDVTPPRPESTLAPSPRTELAARSGALVSRGLEILSASTLASAIEPIALAIEARGRCEPSQVLRITTYAVALARAVGVSSTEIRSLELAALLRNVGMLAYGDRLLDALLVPEPLTQEELDDVFLHPTMGAQILGSTQPLAAAAPLVRHHHERWDGSGYPEGLKGSDIPLGARVLAIVQYYDALTSGAPGNAFDPDLVARLGDALDTVESATFSNAQSDAVEHAFGRARRRSTARPRILVVDDEPMLRELLAKTLAIAEWDVDVAPDGHAALEALRRDAYDLLIVDLKMPGMDGLSLIREANHVRRRLPVVVITGFSTEATAIEAVNLGVAAYLIKPFKVSHLLDAVAKAIGRNIPSDLQRYIERDESASHRSSD